MDLKGDCYEEREQMLKEYIYEVESAPSMLLLLQLEQILLKPENKLFLEKYRGKYLRMARIYTGQLHRKMKQKSRMQEMTGKEYEQEMKLLTNSELFDYLVEFEQAEYSHFLHQLRGEVKVQKKLTQPNQSSLQLFMDNYELMDDTCVGCNKFFYRYFPLQFIINPKDIPVQFLYHYDLTFQDLEEDLDCSEAGSTTKMEVPAKSVRVDLNHIYDSKDNLLRVILKMLNQQGGFIVIGCKKLTHFEEFRKTINNWRLTIMRQVHFYVGSAINQQLQSKITEEIQKIIQDIQPAVIMNKNIEINFVPVHQSPFLLSFGLNQPQQSHQQWLTKNLHILVLKVKPTDFCPYTLSKGSKQISSNHLQSIKFQSNQSSDEEQYYSEPYSFAQLNPLAQGLSLEQISQQSFLVKNIRNLFENHTCT